MLCTMVLALLPQAAGAVCPAGDFAGCRAACTRGEPESCARLAAMYRDGGHGVGRDDRHAAELLRSACQGGSTTACTDLQMMRAQGRVAR